MERLLQYLDDFDDLCGAIGLVWEVLRRGLLAALAAAMLLAVAASAVALALAHPPVALGTSMLLFVILLYRFVTAPSARWHQAA